MTPRPIEMSQPLARRPEARFARYSLVLSFSAFSTAADFRRRLPAPGFTRYDAFDPSIIRGMNEAAGIHHARQPGRRMAARGARPADKAAAAHRLPIGRLRHRRRADRVRPQDGGLWHRAARASSHWKRQSE